MTISDVEMTSKHFGDNLVSASAKTEALADTIALAPVLFVIIIEDKGGKSANSGERS
jgi:hypothetical protein